MNAILDRNLKQINWSTMIMFSLGFWLSGSLILDGVIMPGLSATGMMETSGFASAGYLIFGIFNHLELLCAAIVLTGFLVFSRNHTLNHHQEISSIVLAAILLAIALVYTYFLTPQMSGLGLQLNLFDANNLMSNEMISLHQVYWTLELIKLVLGATLLNWCYRNSTVV